MGLAYGPTGMGARWRYHYRTFPRRGKGLRGTRVHGELSAGLSLVLNLVSYGALFTHPGCTSSWLRPRRSTAGRVGCDIRRLGGKC